MNSAFEELLEIIDLEPIELNLFRGRSPPDRSTRVFGGQVIAQALAAATRTVESEKAAHSLHGYFLRPGDPSLPILYTVDRIRNGKSFATRRVAAIQRGEAILSMDASFHLAEDGVSHQVAMPDVPPPEGLQTDQELIAKYNVKLPPDFAREMAGERAIEMRPCDPRFTLRAEGADPRQHVWIKTTGRMPDDPALHRIVMAYASDMGLLTNSTLPHAAPTAFGIFQTASLDHAVWFHRPFRIDEWLLYTQHSPAAAGARGFNLAALYTRDGILVASVAQEALIRRMRTD